MPSPAKPKRNHVRIDPRTPPINASVKISGTRIRFFERSHVKLATATAIMTFNVP